MLSDDQRADFELFGILKVEQLISKERVSEACRAILSRFEPLKLASNGKWCLDHRPRSKWPDKGFSAKQIGNNIKEVERLLAQPSIMQIVDLLLQHSELDTQMFKRPQVLVTLPNDKDWFVPNDGWHVDTPRLASGIRPGVQLFILLNDIGIQGGGTLAVSGSHHLLNCGEFIRPRDVTKRLNGHPFFAALMGARSTSIAQFHNLQRTTRSMDDINLEITEITGLAGDVYFMDTRVVHSAAPNAKDQPRMMATYRFVRTEMVEEITANR